tara:strand:+ start:191 stop:469 length:279 start_codon:yes stop_codon:yes gene_type:complete
MSKFHNSYIKNCDFRTVPVVDDEYVLIAGIPINSIINENSARLEGLVVPNGLFIAPNQPQRGGCPAKIIEHTDVDVIATKVFDQLWKSVLKK